MKKTVLCQNIIEAANNFDMQGEHEKADQLTKIAKQLTNNEITKREAFNFGRMLGGLTGGLAGYSLAPMLSGANRGAGSLEMTLKFVQKKNPQAYPALAQKVQAYRQQGQSLLQELKQSLQVKPTTPPAAQPQPTQPVQPANPTTLV